jgi:hypothetical protein
MEGKRAGVALGDGGLQAAIAEHEEQGGDADAGGGILAGAREPQRHGKFARKTA